MNPSVFGLMGEVAGIDLKRKAIKVEFDKEKE